MVTAFLSLSPPSFFHFFLATLFDDTKYTQYPNYSLRVNVFFIYLFFFFKYPSNILPSTSKKRKKKKKKKKKKTAKNNFVRCVSL